MKPRRLVLAPLVVLLSLGLTACGPPVIGELGLLRQENGTLEVLVWMCRGSVDEIILKPINSFKEDPTSKPQFPDTAWETEPQVRAPITPPATSPTSFTMPFEEAALKQNILYELFAAGHDGNAYSTSFSASELRTLTPGQVLSNPRDDNNILTRENFEQSAIKNCSRPFH